MPTRFSISGKNESTFLKSRHDPPVSTSTQTKLARQLSLKLNPDGLLVSPGRLERAMLEEDAILIAKKYQFTTLLVPSVHERQLHAGVSDTVVALRKRF